LETVARKHSGRLAILAIAAICAKESNNLYVKRAPRKPPAGKVNS
jgi:hypothetical protein